MNTVRYKKNSGFPTADLLLSDSNDCYSNIKLVKEICFKIFSVCKTFPGYV